MNDFEPPKQIRVEMTRDDVAQGLQLACGLCPIALAVRRAINRPLGQSPSVSVRQDAILVGERCYALPAIASVFIARFDGHTTLAAARRECFPCLPFILERI